MLAGSSPTRLKHLVDRFGPILFDCSFGSELLLDIVNSPEEAFNSRCQFGAWQPCAVSHVLIAAPLPVLVQVAAHPLFQEIDVVAAQSLLFSHQDLLNSPSQLMNALCQIYSINGGGAKRLMDWRTGLLQELFLFFFFFHKQKENVTAWRRSRLSAVVWLVFQWMLACPARFVHPSSLLNQFCEVMAPNGPANTEDLFDFEKTFLLDTLSSFARKWEPKQPRWKEVNNVALRYASKTVLGISFSCCLVNVFCFHNFRLQKKNNNTNNNNI